ncbi:hypothetical protein IFM89_025065 [Coptis chinensis]|uniref:Uncharacterized protein n=1 Tax=Coptis chinensis TaxID=261450 RepID=A0A835HVB9_9MAGN|nr:hypothetical protein IFM89_025065 [Coptis chinensis]
MYLRIGMYFLGFPFTVGSSDQFGAATKDRSLLSLKIGPGFQPCEISELKAAPMYFLFYGDYAYLIFGKCGVGTIHEMTGRYAQEMQNFQLPKIQNSPVPKNPVVVFNFSYCIGLWPMAKKLSRYLDLFLYLEIMFASFLHVAGSDGEDDDKIEIAHKDVPAAVFGDLVNKVEDNNKDGDEETYSKLGALERIKRQRQEYVFSCKQALNTWNTVLRCITSGYASSGASAQNVQCDEYFINTTIYVGGLDPSVGLEDLGRTFPRLWRDYIRENSQWEKDLGLSNLPTVWGIMSACIMKCKSITCLWFNSLANK